MRYGVGQRARERKQAHKAQLRQSKFESERWQRGEGLARRQYDTYDEYINHQAGKLDKVIDRLKETEDEDFGEFKRRFEGCTPLSEARSVLCLGARIGTEVRALHALGYFAIGIDLNPGSDNPYVLPGDFHDLVFPASSVDAIYTNTLDHVYDFEKVLAEVQRLLRPGGLFVADLLGGYEEGFVPGEYESTHWRNLDEFVDRISQAGKFSVQEKRDLGQHRRDHWHQLVFRKPA